MRKLVLSTLKFVVAFFFMAAGNEVFAQCTTTISSFPYLENFEASNGGWTTGGAASDWAWGTPAKPVINAAAGSSKSWITGGLNAPGYNNNENSWLQSPCFNLAALANPYIKFKVFWETEKKYDGASFQYSLNGGTTWVTLGSYADYTACPSNNWFNTTGINALGTHGWSGNIQPTAACTGGAGNGSGGWKIAQHEMSALTGQTNVRFRFTFGAGSVCNGYDGFAIDDIQIGEAPSATGDFNYTCTGSNNVSVTPSVAGCNPVYNWDFGDPASGTSNFSTSPSPSHFYSSPGPYTITMTVTIPGFAPVVVSKSVKILHVDVAVTKEILCAGNGNGELTASVTPAGSYQFSWNTSPVKTTPVINGLIKGTYTVIVTGANSCAASETVTLTEPAELQLNLKQINAYCGKNNGSAKMNPAGGVTPYTFTWYPMNDHTDSIGDLAQGFYIADLIDANGCKYTSSFEIKDQNNLVVNLGRDTFFCPGQRLILAPGNFASYKWQDNSNQPKFTVTQTGIYSVQVTNDSGCVASDEIRVTVDCSDIYFPTGFTPDGNGRNEGFGALGNLAVLGNYSLKVFNRWGELIFTTTNPSKKWSGLTGKEGAGTNSFIWLAEYTLPNRGKQTRKGVITLIR
jgi:gliding motility-associated-like protein